MSQKEFFLKIKETINTRDKWTRKSFARDVEGQPVNETDNRAVCFCLIGAMNKVSNYKPENYKYYDELIKFLPYRYQADRYHSAHNIVEFNDKSPYSEVIRVLDEAIAES